MLEGLPLWFLGELEKQDKSETLADIDVVGEVLLSVDSV